MGGQGGDTTLSPSRNPVLIRVLEKRRKRGDRVALFLVTGGSCTAACVIHQHLSPCPPKGQNGCAAGVLCEGQGLSPLAPPVPLVPPGAC